MLSAVLSAPAVSVATALLGFFVMIWPGYAVLHLLGLGRHRWKAALFAGPAVTTAIWTIALSDAAWASVPLRDVANVVWLTTAIAAASGLLLAVISRPQPLPATSSAEPSVRWLWISVVTIPFVIMPSVLWFGLGDFANSTMPDSWSYVTVADYLAHVPRGADSGLSPLHQYASHLMHVRNASSAILAQLAAGFGVKADQTMALYCLLLLFAFAGALVAFGMTVFRHTLAILYLLVLAEFGWTANIVFAGNFDQLLLLPFLPLIASLALRAGSGEARVDTAGLLIGVLAAAAFLAYVELAFAALAVALAFGIATHQRPLALIGRGLIVLCLATVLFLLLTWPALPPLLAMLQHQFVSSIPGSRPGEGMFGGLTSFKNLPATFWALGGEHGKHFGWPIGALLFAALAIGAVVERRRWLALLALATVLAGVLYLIVHEVYSYGAYKLISVNFWMVSFFTVAGGIWLARWLSRRFQRPHLAATALLVSIGVVALDRTIVQARLIKFTANTIQQRQFREALDVAAITGQSPTLLSVRSPLANQWAVYYLSDVPLLVSPYRIYMAQAHVIPYMERARKIDPSAIKYILTDRDDDLAAPVSGAKRIWNGQAYSLWQIVDENWSVLTDAKTPNGIEPGRLGLGGGATEFLTMTAKPHLAHLTGILTAGPQAPAGVDIFAAILQGAGVDQSISLKLGPMHLPIDLKAGPGSFAISLPQPPSDQIPAIGDKPVILWLSHPRLEGTDKDSR
ncbi:MAG: hypothetical protein HZA66_24070 [Rhodopseudomonas palustris]|uniref:Transmembrane protein n=1 Tax=Rhodopseudomonas palustris TaxID=1076 RepID=A0A933VWU5_RHOPL|nr:hypothetical protein [Rhodopseudomonas palustris]